MIINHLGGKVKDIGYKSLAYEYDDFYRNKDYPRETAFITKFLRQKNVSSLLDVGCGTGTHMALLEKNGFHVTGLDLNVEMLQVAKGKVQGKLHTADMTNFSLSKTFDAVICMFAAFNHNLTIDSAQKALKCFKRHLVPEGVILIDLYNAKNSGSKVDQGKEIERTMEWSYDPTTQITHSSVSYKTSQGIVKADPFMMRHFSMDEMRQILLKEGFKNIEFWDNFTETFGTPSSKNLLITAQN